MGGHGFGTRNYLFLSFKSFFEKILILIFFK